MIGEQGVEGTAKEKKQEGKGRGKEGEGTEKKDVGFDVEVGRILESSQNEVRGSMNLTINQPLLSLLPVRPPSSSWPSLSPLSQPSLFPTLARY